MLQGDPPAQSSEGASTAETQVAPPELVDNPDAAAAAQASEPSINEGPTESGADSAATEGSALETLFAADELRARGEAALAWLQTRVLNFDVAIEAVLLIAAIAPAAIFGPRLKQFINNQIAPRAPYGALRRAANAFGHIATPIALYFILQIAVLVLRALDRQTALVEAGVSLLTAWIVIRLVTLVIRSPFWSKVAFYVAWPLAALDAFGVLGEVVRQLEAFSVPIGEDASGNPETFSALDLIRTLMVFGVLFWAASFTAGFIKGRIDAIDELTISFKALLGKILDILLPVVALVAALQIVGFPFGTLAIFGGAIGLGIGLGMQSTVSNFLAGFTLIADKSIKPGDVIEVDDTYGWVTEMNARYVTLRTRDGTSHLVPNDKFILDGVTNWSHGDRIVRLHAPFGVSYDVQDVRALARRAEETALTVERVLKNPAPRCNLMEFGDSSINFDLRFWINDPANGSANVRSDVFMEIWDMLHEMGIEIPFPQRDLHVRSMPQNAAPIFETAPPQAESKA